MRELTVNMFLSLDGVMQAPGGPDEDTSDGFDRGGWAFGYWDEQVNEFQDRHMSKPSELVLGRKTYETFASFWPNTDNPGADVMNNATKHVATRTLTTLEWENSRLLGADVPAAIRALKAEDGPDLQVIGSADLLQTLIGQGLVDTYTLLIFPVLLGSGKRLFDTGTLPEGLELTDSLVSPSGVFMGTYRAAGAIKGGSF